MFRWIKRLLLLFVLIAIAAGGGGWWLYSKAIEPYRGYSVPEVFVDIPSGTGPNGIGQKLIAAGVVRDDLTFRTALFVSGRARELKAGEYRFAGPVHALDVIDKISRGDVYKRLLTFREGLTILDMAQVFEEKGFGKAEDFRKAAQNVALIADLDPAAEDLEGYLFPETYSLPRDTPATVVVEQMVGGFKKALTEEMRSSPPPAPCPRTWPPKRRVATPLPSTNQALGVCMKMCRLWCPRSIRVRWRRTRGSSRVPTVRRSVSSWRWSRSVAPPAFAASW